MKIVIASIMKNEAKHIKRWKESANDADAIYVLDTGSDDDSVAIAKELGINVYQADIQPWHFARARNMLLDMLPTDIDYVINLDLDEVLIDGWRGHLESMDPSITRPRYNYTWSWEEDGSPGLQYHGDKIVRRNGYKWVNAVHEVMVPVDGLVEKQGFIDLKIEHHADNTKSRSSYLPLLALDVQENPNNDRNRYYYARELFFHGKYPEAIRQFRHHLSMPEAKWDAERAWSMRYLAKMLPAERESWLLKACAEYPAGREPWFDLAQFYYDKNNFAGCLFAANKVLSINNKQGLYLNEADAWGWKPHDVAAIAAYNVGSYEMAIIQGLIALRLNPGDARLQENVRYYEEKIPENVRAQYRAIADVM
jgi:glycosyltransferase involved in cell wall biosynthesis